MIKFLAITAACLLLFCNVVAHIRIEAPEVHFAAHDNPSFVRSAVESMTGDDNIAEPFSRFSVPLSYGDVFLPLRSAVESVPSISLRTAENLQYESQPGLRTFVRDSVESAPLNDYDEELSNLQEEEEEVNDGSYATPEKLILKSQENSVPDAWYSNDKYAAFVEPSNNDELPQLYRADSPYQQLIKPEQLHNEQPYGALTYNAREEYNQAKPYGALAQLKDSSKPVNNRKSFNSSPKVLCYFTNWAFYRKADGKFVPEHLDSKLCTHLIYSFASLDPDHLVIKEFDPWVDMENQYFARAVQSGIPVLIAMGGWTDSSGDKYSRLAGNEIKRKVFASNLVGFLQRNGFAGLHLDWTYPKCWQSDCSAGPASDKPNLTKLLQEIRAEFNRVDKNLQLGVAISGYKEIINEAYDFPELSKIVDYLTVMTYDYHGAWEQKTGHVSPLYGRKTDKYPQYNTDYAMQLLLKLGAKKEKLIMGIPFYGQTFTLERESSSIVGEGQPAIGAGEPGEFTKQPGMLAYYEICQRIRKHKWMTGRDAEHKSGPYAMLRNQWVSYDDANSVEAKARYAINNGFGGVAAWTVDLDDFQNRCCSEAYPLLKAINRAMGRIASAPPTRINCERPPTPVTPAPPVMTTISSDGSASGGGVHDHTTSRPSTSSSTVWWVPESSSTTTTTTTTTTARTTYKTTKTTQRPTTSTTSSTTKRTTTKTTESAAHTTIPSPAVVRPVVHPSKNCETGQFYADSTNCNAYYQCTQGANNAELRQMFCPGGLHWNDQSKNCDWPASAQCKQTAASMSHKPAASSSTSTTSTTSTTTTRATTKATQRTTRATKPTSRTTRKPLQKPTARPTLPSAKCNEGEYYSHRKCDKYYICVNGNLVPNACGGNLHWDAIRKTCDWPENVKCVTTKTYLRIIQAYGKAAANPNDACNGEERVPYPGDCTKYLFCLWNRLQGADCGPGLHFNQATGNCDWPAAAKCNADESGYGGETLVPGDNEIPQQGKPPKPVAQTTQKPTTTTTSTTVRPTYPTDKPVLQPLDGYYKVVCYFTNWAWYRKGLGRYTPDNINTDLCTHIVYGFAVLDYSNLVLRTHDSWADIDNKFYTRVSDLKSKGVKVSLALGGWNDSQGDKYSRLVRDPAARARFVKHAIEFLEKYGFEGLDLDWEYPVCWQTDCNKGMADEKQGFTAWVRELSEALKPRGMLLSTAVSPSKKIIDAGYDVPVLAKYFDWIAVMTYDFHGQWDKRTGHVAPLYYHPEDEFDYFNANFSINYWIEKGAPSRKIVMGMPLYGQSFTLENQRNNGLNAKAPAGGKAGEFTKASGFLAYYEICDRIKTQGWQVVQDERGRMGPYAYKGTQWVSFDDAAMIRKKSQLIRALNLGGGMVWALDLDDFRNRCGEGVHPLLTQIHDVLKDPPQSYEPLPGLTPVGTEPESIKEQQETSAEVGNNEAASVENNVDPNLQVEEGNFGSETFDSEDTEDNTIQGDFKVVCYFTNWAWYRQGGGKYLPEDIDTDLCTHIVYGFAVLNRDTLTIQPHDSWADLDNKFYERVVAHRSKGAKVTVAIGGWNDSAGDKYARLVRSASARARFVRHVVEFIEKYGFDGLDLDWEYPVCWQVDCNKGTADEKEGFTSLVKELSQAFKPKNLLLSAAVSPNKKVIDAGYDVAELSTYFDWIAVMTYDYHGQWDKRTGHVAPMYEHPEGTSTFNANFSINYWLEKGADRQKIIMGMPMYGQSFSLAQSNEHNLNAPTYGGGEAGEATRARGFLSYYEICSYVRNRGWNVVRDPRGRMGPYAYSRDQWVSFDDQHMIRHKSEYVKAMGLGGAMIWALDLDDFKNECGCGTYPLLKTINTVLRNYPENAESCILEKEQKTMIAHEAGASAQLSKPKPKPTVNTKATTTKPTTASYYTEAEKPIKKMECAGRNFAAHEQDCNKYYICQYGELIEQKCPPGLHWNENHCDWPNSSKCSIPAHMTTTATPMKPTHRTTTVSPQKPTKKPISTPSKKPISPSKPSKPLSDNEEYKLVCYFTNWAWYRPGEGKYVPEDIDENLCTHIVYGFAVLNSNSLTIKIHDSWADVDNRFFERVVAYKEKGIRVTVAIGGWNDSLGSKYARLVLDPQARARFIKSVLDFVDKYGFEGLDLDWEYPVCWQVDCSKGSPAEKAGFVALVRELSEEFKPRGLLLSAAVSPSKKVIDAGYDVVQLSRYFDWIAVMTYDFHGHWDKETGHVAPLYYVEGDTNEYFNGNFTMHYWLELGAPAKKLIMGMPLYGQSFTLENANKRELNSKTIGPGQAGKYTRAGGFLAYYEICEKVSAGGWTVERDAQGRIGPYAYQGNQWVSYDDVSDIRRKSQFVRQLGLGGGMVWALDLDDFRGRCGCGKHPLLRTLSQELRGIPGQKAYDCT